MAFKIIKYKNGEEYPNIYEDGKPEFYIKHAEIIGQRYGISLSEIKKVMIGDSENPITEIYFEDGLVLYDEEMCPWMRNDNKKRVEEFLKEGKS